MAADYPVLALGLVVDSSADRVVKTQTHTGGDEYTVNFVSHYVDGSPVGNRNVVVTAHCGTAEASARGLIKVVACS